MCSVFLFGEGVGNCCGEFRLTLGCIPECTAGQPLLIVDLGSEKCLLYPAVHKKCLTGWDGQRDGERRTAAVNYVWADERGATICLQL